MKLSTRAKTRSICVGLAAAAALFAASITGMAQDKEQAAPTAGNYTRGVQRWADTCAHCHNMRDPKEFRDDQWHVIVTHMRVRAGLTGQDARDILEFLQKSN